MAYARWGANSDIYMYEDISGGWTCCGCLLADEEDGDFWNVSTLQEMHKHIITHMRLGHKVPRHTLERVLREMDDDG